MKNFIYLVEKYLIRISIFILMALVLVQGIMTRDDLRLYLSLGERLEGQKLELPASNQAQNESRPVAQKQSPGPETVLSPRALVTISLDKFSSLPRAYILVNNQKFKSFSSKEVKLELSAGDTLEIDSTYYNFPVTFMVKDTSSNVAFPQKNTSFEANQGIVMLGKVIVK